MGFARPGEELNESLYWAARNGLALTIEALVASGVDLNQRSKLQGFESVTPLIAVCLKGEDSPIPVETLLYAGADTERDGICGAGDLHSVTPLWVATIRNHHQVAAKLVEYGANIDRKQQKTGVTVLMQTVIANLPAMCKTLLALGADPSLKDPLGRTAFDFAAYLQVREGGRDEITQVLNQAVERTENPAKGNPPVELDAAEAVAIVSVALGVPSSEVLTWKVVGPLIQREQLGVHKRTGAWTASHGRFQQRHPHLLTAVVILAATLIQHKKH